MPTPADLFKQMPERFNASKAGNLNAAVVFDLTGDDGGQWTVQIADGKCEVLQTAADSPTATVKMASGDYTDMVSGKLNPMMAFMSGKIKVEGDLNSVMKVQQVFGM